MKGKRLGFTLLEIERLVAAGASADAPLDADVARHLSPQQVKDRLVQLKRQRDEVEGAAAARRLPNSPIRNGLTESRRVDTRVAYAGGYLEAFGRRC